MRSEAEDAHGRAGPQGTQVYSRDEIAACLDQSDAGSGTGQAGLVLISVGGEEPGEAGQRAFPLTSDRITVGRSHICDVCIEEPSMSSEHARLVCSDGAWRIINLLSTNGVFVNGEKVFSHRLSDGDEIRLGRTVLRFRDARSGGQSGGGSRQWLTWVGVVGGAAVVAALVFWLLS